MRKVVSGERVEATESLGDGSALDSLLLLYRERRQLESALNRLEHSADDDRSLRTHLERRAMLDESIAAQERLAFDITAEGRLHPVDTLAPVLDGARAECEIFNMLQTKLEALDSQSSFRCVGTVSAAPGEGKTTIALSLALTLAQRSSGRVLFIEADLRRPCAENYLGLCRRIGLSEWLADSGSPIPLRRLEPTGLHFLSAGHELHEPSRVLASRSMAQLVDVARHAFDVVILDCPPPSPMPDTVILARLLDGFLLVVRNRHTAREQLAASLGNLKPEAIRGVVLNDYDELLPRLYSPSRALYQRRRS